MAETLLILLRHGATAANVREPYTIQGLRPDAGLTELGKRQARAAAKALRAYAPTRVHCSPLKRARQTARVIARPLRVPVDVEAALAEADTGDWTGLTWAAIERRWPAAFRAFHANPARSGYPGGENLAQVRARALPAVASLVGRHPGQTLVVVGHGTVNRVLLAHWLGLPPRLARKVPQDNAAINLVEFRQGQAKVRTVNCTIPLAGLLLPARLRAAS